MRLPVEKFLPLAALSLLSACGGGSAAPLSVAQMPATGPAADYPMVLGASYVVDGVTYTPVDKMNYDAVGHAEIGPDGGMAVSAAHRTLPLPSYVEVTALDSGKTVLVRVERRGPMSGKNLIEISPGAAAQLGLSAAGNAPVRVRRVNPVEVDRAALRAGSPAAPRMDTPKSLLAVLQRKLDTQDGVVRPVTTLPDPTPAVASLPPKSEPKPKSAPKAEPKAKPAPSLAAKVEPAPKAPVAARAGIKGNYFVQVGAFANKANADASASKIGGSALSNGKLWRVRSGPFASEADAQAALAKARGAGYKDARIQRTD